MPQPLTAAVRYLSGEREPVRVATTANITLQGLLVIDDVELEVGDRVLVKDQTDQKQNGIYLASEGRWFRAPDASYTRAIDQGVTVAVQEGTAGNGKTFKFTSSQPVVGVDPITVIYFLSDTIGQDIVNQAVAAITPIQEAAEAAAELAGDYAAGLNLPAISAPDGNKALLVKADGSGYEAAFIDKDNITTDATDPLRITISNLSYPRGLVTSDPAAAASNRVAIQDCIQVGKFVELPDGTFFVNSHLTMADQVKLIGHGQAATYLTSASSSTDIIQVPNGTVYYEISNFSITKQVAPTGSSTAIRCLGSSSLSEINNMNISNHVYGMILQSAGYGKVHNNFVERCLSDGFYITQSAVNFGSQWVLTENLSQLNGGCGYRVVSYPTGVGQMSVGSYINNRSFANSEWGLVFLGRADCPIQGVRIEGGFFGEDGKSEIYLDTYGISHMIHGVFVEGAGTLETGPAANTPASHIGEGIGITVNNVDVKIIDANSTANSGHGIRTAASRTVIVGGNIAKNGIYVAGSKGISGADGSKVSIVGVSFGDVAPFLNTGGNIGFDANAPSRQVIGCLPVSVNRTIRSSFTYNFPSVAANSTASVTAGVSGAVLGDIVSVASNNPVAGILFWAQITASDVATVYATNLTGSAIDPGDATFRLTLDRV